MLEIVSGQVDREPVFVCPFDAGQLCGGRGLMSVSESAFASVGFYQIGKLALVDPLAYSRQIAGLVMAPYLAVGQIGYPRHGLGPVVRECVNFGPAVLERTILGITSAAAL